MSTWIEGVLDRVLWASDRSSYAVVLLEVDGEPLTAVGELGQLAEMEAGTFVSLEGAFEEHPVHGRQFRARGLLLGSPRTERGLVSYLASSAIPGVGPALAARIVDRFGMSTLEILSTEPERLQEVDGIGPKRARLIAERWNADEEGRSLVIFLRGLGVDARRIEQIRRRYGTNAARVVRSAPYRLAEEIAGIGFKTADRIARELGLPDDHPERVRAAVVHSLRSCTQEGHCYLDRDELERALEELGVPTAELDRAVEDAEAAGLVVRELERSWYAPLYDDEVFVARELRRRVVVQERLDADDERIRAAEEAEGIALDPSQREAVRTALGGGVVVVTGGPGTGKTTLLRVLLCAAGATDWLLASPTGRAAKRLQEATGRPAQTLHRLLEYNPGKGGFQRSFTHPLEGSGLVVDEASMVDLPLFRALLEALPHPDRPFSLVLVGDADQLPSVGAGQVLRDILDSGVVPAVRLEQVHRQARGSPIVRLAHAVREGWLPDPLGGDGLFLVEREDPEALRRTLLKVVEERLPANGFSPDDIQVLSPTRRGVLGIDMLNRLLQARLNGDAPVVRDGERPLREGDRVICIKNSYDLDIFNGDRGTVVGKRAEGIAVDFDERVVLLPWEEIHRIELAYALTVHKAQGSEYPAVVFVCHPSHGIMLRRNLFYTAITRARRFLCVLGTRKACLRAVRRADACSRNTALAERLRRS